MFMRQKRKETTQLIWIASHGQFICSDHSSNFRGASSLEQTRLLGHVNTQQRCEIKWEALEFSEEHKWLCDSLKFKAKPEIHCVQRDFSIYTSPLFPMDLL